MSFWDILDSLYFAIRFAPSFWLTMVVFAAVYVTVAMLDFAVCRRLMNVLGLSLVSVWVSWVFSYGSFSEPRMFYGVRASCDHVPSLFVVTFLFVCIAGLAALQWRWRSEFWAPRKPYRRYLPLPLIAVMATYLVTSADYYHCNCLH